jgi:hypothetical protein
MPAGAPTTYIYAMHAQVGGATGPPASLLSSSDYTWSATPEQLSIISVEILIHFLSTVTIKKKHWNQPIYTLLGN